MVTLILAAWVVSAYTMDTLQTLSIMKDDRHKEIGLIARHVPRRWIPLYFAVAASVVLTAAWFLPGNFRIYGLAVVAIIETIVIVRNHILGVRI